jgi:D-alanyl-D-alanine carboxypeptidase
VLQADKQRHWSGSELIAVAETAGRVSEPGVAHHYSNTNYAVLGELIHAVTGRSWSDEVRTRIVERLGLEHTAPVQSGGDAPVGYTVANKTFLDATHIADPSIGGAAGGLQSTGRDLLRFLTALEDGTLLTSESRTGMETFVPAEDLSRFGIEHTYGLGIEQYRNDSVTILGHMGTGQAQSSFIGFDRKTQRAIAVQTNTANPGKSALIAVESLLASNTVGR